MTQNEAKDPKLTQNLRSQFSFCAEKYEKSPESFDSGLLGGTPEGTRTPDLLIRRNGTSVLYRFE